MSPFRHIDPSRFNLPADVQWTLIATFKTMLLNIYWLEMLNIASCTVYATFNSSISNISDETWLVSIN
ncbi:hypothetical protein T4D_521 [Trichinella pseudospiralis]|uniref:Uncharacterized protein n=1 Tax=Trichinella pseudospiralis TaxID=6337 RepID=A0A0V1G1I0_TRIPS|nr:hypothetical protein T4D_521 [Trichinella pseudospiralis]